VTTAEGTRPASLPEVYAALMSDQVEAFPALRPHQRHAWHAFLVQLGAMAMHRAGRSDLPQDASEWLALIRSLTADWPNDEPWQLVVGDITKPAFMQPPASSPDKEKEYKGVVATPDELDLLVTSKNHDLKMSVMSEAGVDDWLFALVTLQTMAGYDGRYNYGVSRMTSGYGNRPSFSITPSMRPGGHLKRDMTALLDCRQGILADHPVIDNGIALMWLEHWDGTKSETSTIDRMEPFYIEICRRVRLRQAGGKLEALRANSLARRIYDIKGMTGDPWAPVSKSANQKGTPPAFLGLRKFGYERVADGLFSADWTVPPLLQLTPGDRNLGGTTQLVARGMVRGEGGTAGYHERVVPLKPKMAQIFGRGGNKEEIGDIARERIADIGKVKNILRRAIATFAAHGKASDTSPEQRSRANPWSDRLDEIIDAGFFDALQEEAEEDDRDERRDIRNRWLRNGNDGVVDHAAKILRDAETALPCLAIHRYKAQVQADNVFWGGLRGANGIPGLFDRVSNEDPESRNDDRSQADQNSTEQQMPLSN
jgi:CRISPR system Cascade subunit CasA